MDDENLGCGPHTDYGVMTILAQTVSGLQVRNRQNEWVEVPVIPNAFVVNLGYALLFLASSLTLRIESPQPSVFV